MCLRLLVAHVELIGRMKQQPELLDVCVHCEFCPLSKACRQATSASLRVESSALKAKLTMFEYSMGLLMKCCLNTVEALQVRLSLGLYSAVVSSLMCVCVRCSFFRDCFSLCLADVRSAAAHAALRNSP